MESRQRVQSSLDLRTVTENTKRFTGDAGSFEYTVITLLYFPLRYLLSKETFISPESAGATTSELRSDAVQPQLL